MNDAKWLPLGILLAVRVSQAARDAAGDEHSQRSRQFPTLGIHLADELGQVYPSDVLHDHIVGALIPL